MSRFVSIPLVMMLLAGSVAFAQDDFLPTPYTAEQIRDEWQPGLELTTHDTTPEGESWTRTTVREASAESVSFAVVTLGADLEPVGEETVGEATWIQLRDHARFPASRAGRTRETRETAFGELEGWLYVVDDEDGGVSEFFFADRFPGPPVIYGKSRDGESVYRSEIIDRW
jgi:hypothetical protein